MFKILFLLFITVPIIEIYLLIEVGSRIGAFNTICVILLTAVIGTALLKQQGLSTLARVQQSMDQGRVPATELIEGLMLLFSGALLLTPGFFTDFIGFICLVPGFRNRIAGNLLKKILLAKQKAEAGEGNVEVTIEGEYWEDSNENKKDKYLP